MVKVSLKELIEYGRFGPVSLGMGREAVASFLGAPDDWSAGTRKYSQATILKYGDVEFHFDPRDGGLWLIHLEGFESPHAGGLVELDPWVIGPALTVRKMEECLSLSSIRYQVTDQADWDDYKFMVAGAGAKLIFAGEQWLLRSLSHSKVAAS